MPCIDFENPVFLIQWYLIEKVVDKFNNLLKE